MAARQQRAQDAIGRSFHPSGFHGSLDDDERRERESPGYVLEWSGGHACRRRTLEDGRALRTEVVRAGGAGERLVVVTALDTDSRQGERVLQTLEELAGIGRRRLEGHLGAGGRRGAGRDEGRGRGGRWWSWAYPEMGPGRTAVAPGGLRGGSSRGAGAREVSICRVSLWVTSNLSILLLDAPTAEGAGRRQRVRRLPAHLRHEDAATNSALGSPSSRGTVENGFAASGAGSGTLETELWDSVGGDAFLEETLGELVYAHWLRFLETVGPDTSKQETSLLWDALKSLERNLDDFKKSHRRTDTGALSNSSGSGLDCGLPLPDDWKDLISRTQNRLHLLQQPQVFQQQQPSRATEPPKKDINERALDRVAYIGGLLLPITVVSSVLAIEGSYGPEGDKFWVFWVASVAASVVAVVVIYIERLRRLQVWFEVATDAVMETGGALADEAFLWAQQEDEAEERGERRGEEDDVCMVQDGDGLRAWRRGELGWGGAVKQATGYYRWRGHDRLRFDMPKMLG